MLNLLVSDPLSFLIWAAGLIIAVDIHEFSHAWMSEKLGDPTARLEGRLTLNPLAHLDPLGTLALLVAHIGWGKPVPIDPYNLKNPRRDAALISLAGPGSNLILAIILSLILRFTMPSSFLVVILAPIIILNVGLGIFNLIPVPPLDGAKIVSGFLPEESAQRFEDTLSSYGVILLLFLILPLFGGASLVSLFISPIISFLVNLLLPFKII